MCNLNVHVWVYLLQLAKRKVRFYPFFETSNGGDDRSIPSAGDAVNHRIDEPVQRCQKTHYHQYLLPILHLLPYNLKERNNVN